MMFRPTRRAAFTLVELLIVITVIAILIAMLTVAVVPALKRSSEFAIQTEMSQLERAIESFKTKYGFYPPSFKNIGDAPDLLPYINRIAPNHSEGNGNTGTLLREWWDNCGSQIRADGSDLVFWLSGLSKNKQFPLTGGRGFIADQNTRGVPVEDQGWIAFDGTGFTSLPPDNNSIYERDSYYDFVAKQLVQHDVDFGKVRAYYQPKGRPSPYLYLDNANYYPTVSSGDPPNDGGYENGIPNSDGSGSRNYYNPNTFQLITWGMDGLAGESVLDGDVRRNIVPLVGPEGTDNIANFVGEGTGRLERILLGTD